VRTILEAVEESFMLIGGTELAAEGEDGIVVL
jgi:hypothetical protein